VCVRIEAGLKGRGGEVAVCVWVEREVGQVGAENERLNPDASNVATPPLFLAFIPSLMAPTAPFFLPSVKLTHD